jgi:hypothetical protein
MKGRNNCPLVILAYFNDARFMFPDPISPALGAHDGRSQSFLSLCFTFKV